MQTQQRRTLLIIVALIVGTVAIMGLRGHAATWLGRYPGGTPSFPGSGVQGLGVSGKLVQDKILQGSDGRVSLALTLTAPEQAPVHDGPAKHVDLVVVLDRSGSMNGRKIDDARRAILRLIETLAPEDRLALVAYSNTVETHAGLTPMTGPHRRMISDAVAHISANGGTNLGAGLKCGIDLALAAPSRGNVRRIILISDGLANQGLTSPAALGNMAAASFEKTLAVSTVGIGQEFNEALMTRLADYGGGSYYYLENPAAFAAVFQKEYHHARAVAAENLRVSLSLPPGVRLVDAGGYPVKQSGARVVFHPGSLGYGKSRTLYLTLRMPTDTPRTFGLEDIRVQYQQGADQHTAVLPGRFSVACVNDADDVMASIRKDLWRDLVLQEDFGRLKEEVAADIREGQADRALERIHTYRQEKTSVNRVVGSGRVRANLADEVEALRGYVKDTFSGQAPAVAAKQKQNAKALQYEGYRERRDKN